MPEVGPHASTGLLIKEELDIIVPSISQPLGSPNELLAGGIDEIKGDYDMNARPPESESNFLGSDTRAINNKINKKTIVIKANNILAAR